MSQDRVMLLIDADNVSVDVMEQAVRLLLNQHGGLHVRRAYCTAESAVSNQAVFKRLGIKPMVNLAAGKNSTDIALAVDAIDLVLAERPDVVVIASSDSDFAPLVHRLREKGCVVRGIGRNPGRVRRLHRAGTPQDRVRCGGRRQTGAQECAQDGSSSTRCRRAGFAQEGPSCPQDNPTCDGQGGFKPGASRRAHLERAQAGRPQVHGAKGCGFGGQRFGPWRGPQCQGRCPRCCDHPSSHFGASGSFLFARAGQRQKPGLECGGAAPAGVAPAGQEQFVTEAVCTTQRSV